MNDKNQKLVIIIPNKIIAKKIFKEKKYLNKFKSILNIYLNIKELDQKKLLDFLKNNSLKFILNELNKEFFKNLEIDQEEFFQAIDKNKIYILVYKNDDITNIIEI